MKCNYEAPTILESALFLNLNHLFHSSTSPCLPEKTTIASPYSSYLPSRAGHREMPATKAV